MPRGLTGLPKIIGNVSVCKKNIRMTATVLTAITAVMVAAFHGGVEGGDQWVNSSELLAATRLAMDFWFENDFTNVNCLTAGGTATCRELSYPWSMYR